jgi:hypothetical protein
MNSWLLDFCNSIILPYCTPSCWYEYVSISFPIMTAREVIVWLLEYYVVCDTTEHGTGVVHMRLSEP